MSTSSSSSSSTGIYSRSSSSSSSSSGLVFDLIGYLVVEINGSNTKNYFLPLYNHNTGLYTASNRDFWGCIYAPGDLVNLAEDGFLSMTINSNPYWLHVYTADAVVCDCCSNLSGVWRPI